MSRLRRWFVGLCLLLAGVSSFASFPAPTSYGYPGYSGPRGSFSTTYGFASYAAACAAYAPLFEADWPATWTLNSQTFVAPNTCHFSINQNGSGATSDALMLQSVACPANSTGTSSCTCNSGFHTGADGASCAVNDTCTPLAGQHVTGIEVQISSYSSKVPSSACSGGCTVTLQESDIMTGYCGAQGCFKGPYSGVVQDSPCTATGPASDSNSTNVQDFPSPPPPGMCPGTVNGVAVNVPCSSSSSTNAQASASGPSSTASSPSGTTPGTSSTSDSTTCSAGQCTTTTTTKTNNPDGTTTTSSGSTSAAQSDYCQKNPGKPECAGQGSPNPVGASELYTPKDKTVSSVLTGAKNTLVGSPIGSAVGGFFNVGAGGSCPDTTWTIPYLNATVSASIWCSTFAGTAFAVIRTVLLLVASFMAFRIAIE